MVAVSHVGRAAFNTALLVNTTKKANSETFATVFCESDAQVIGWLVAGAMRGGRTVSLHAPAWVT